jgi:hypothetical protein
MSIRVPFFGVQKSASLPRRRREQWHERKPLVPLTRSRACSSVQRFAISDVKERYELTGFAVHIESLDEQSLVARLYEWGSS